mgnify:CR=1 FL=1
MPTVSPKIGEFLLKTTGSKDIDESLHKILIDYLEIKLKELNETINDFEKKWGMNFEEFKRKLKEDISRAGNETTLLKLKKIFGNGKKLKL